MIKQVDYIQESSYSVFDSYLGVYVDRPYMGENSIVVGKRLITPYLHGEVVEIAKEEDTIFIRIIPDNSRNKQVALILPQHAVLRIWCGE